MTISSPNTNDTTLIQDGQAAGSITPADMRVINNSLAGVFPTTQTGSYTAVLNDRGTRVLMNSASALNFTVPPNASVAFDVGTVIEVGQKGAGQVTIVAGAGVTLNTSTGTLTSRTQNSVVSVWKELTNTWWVSGDLT